MLWWMKIFARRFITITAALDAVVAGGDLAVLDLHIGGGMGELALGVLARTFVALKFATDLQLQPARVLAVQQAVHIDNVGHRVCISGYIAIRIWVSWILYSFFFFLI